MKHCKDCEPAQESHFVAYTSVVLGWVDEPIFYLLEKIFNNLAEKLADKITLPFFNLMVFLKLGLDENRMKKTPGGQNVFGMKQSARNKNERVSFGSDSGRFRGGIRPALRHR